MQQPERRTDLATECAAPHIGAENGVLVKTHSFSHGTVEILDLSDPAARTLGKPTGRYITLSTGRLWLMDTEGKAAVIAVLSALCRDLLARACPWAKSVLFVGLGNRHFTADAIGSRVIDKLEVNRHLDTKGGLTTAAIAPGVVGQTGLETAELVRGAVEHMTPDAVFAIDALAARDTERLATTLQLTDTGIAPGSGMGNRRKGLTQENLGVPVLALGVPTIVDSATLVCEALSAAGEDASKIPNLAPILENGRSFFVTRKDSDIAVEVLASVVADALGTLGGRV